MGAGAGGRRKRPSGSHSPFHETEKERILARVAAAFGGAGWGARVPAGQGREAVFLPRVSA